jgi:fatty-acyl-CoA synthase
MGKAEEFSEAPLMILYTSGTTGFPKGAMITPEQIRENAINTLVDWGLEEGERYIVQAPLFHTGGWNVLALPLILGGGRLVIHDKFDAARTLEDISKHKVTVYFGVPTMFLMLMESPLLEKSDFSNIKFMVSGGAPCPAYVIEYFSARNVAFKQGFGLTEVGPNCFRMPENEIARKIGSVGLPMRASTMKLINDSQVEVAPGEVGELVIAGDHVCGGYFNRPEDSEKSNPDGFFRTGDYAYQDAEGFYYIVGRKKEMFISGGENVYPKEIEDKLLALPDVVEVAVVGVPDPRWGEVGLAALALASKSLQDFERMRSEFVENLKKHLKQVLASYKVPKNFVFFRALPRNTVGKIDKKAIREHFMSDRLNDNVN